MKVGVAVVGIAMLILAGSSEARAALTSSEKAQIRDFVGRSQPENATRVRALVVRTDLTAEESMAALTEALVPVPFTDARAAFVRELVFGGASASSRPLLAHAATSALLARADAIYQKYVGGLDHELTAIAELIAIYTFIDVAIANAGHPTLAAHDASAGISAAAYDDASKALRDHIEKNSGWLRGDGKIVEGMGRLRAQAQVALIDMLPDGLTRRVDAADRLGLKGARRQMLIEWGILFQDAGVLDDAKASQVRQMLMRLPGARTELELLYAGEDRAPLHARGTVAHAFGSRDPNPFGDEVSPVSVDVATSAVAQDLALLAIKRALDSRADLRLQSERDAAVDPARLLGKPRAPSVEHVVAAGAHLLLLDAARALDLAFVRFLGGKPEGAALLSDTVGALAAQAPATDGKPDPKGLSLEFGKAGASSWTTMSAIRLAPNGAAVGFALDGHTWVIERPSPSFAVTRITRDGQPVSIQHLLTARTPPQSAKKK